MILPIGIIGGLAILILVVIWLGRNLQAADLEELRKSQLEREQRP